MFQLTIYFWLLALWRSATMPFTPMRSDCSRLRQCNRFSRKLSATLSVASGHRLVIEYATMGAIDQRVKAEETADVVIGSLSSIKSLVKLGHLDSQSTTAKSGLASSLPQIHMSRR
jgi:hypothetical protein